MKLQFAFAVLCLTGALEGSVFSQQVARSESDVGALVRGPSFPDSYRELSASYDASVTPELIAMLNAGQEEAHWPRVAHMLGVVGDERAVEALITFVEKPSTQRLSNAQHDSRQAAIMSLGYLINRSGNERALRYLVEGLTPSVWRQRNVQGIPSWMNSNAEYDSLLSTYALMALSLSGHPRAGEALRSLQQTPVPAQVQFRKGLDTTLPQWLEVHGLVAERGVAGMYEYYETQRQLKAEREAGEANRLREAQ